MMDLLESKDSSDLLSVNDWLLEDLYTEFINKNKIGPDTFVHIKLDNDNNNLHIDNLANIFDNTVYNILEIIKSAGALITGSAVRTLLYNGVSSRDIPNDIDVIPVNMDCFIFMMALFYDTKTAQFTHTKNGVYVTINTCKINILTLHLIKYKELDKDTQREILSNYDFDVNAYLLDLHNGSLCLPEHLNGNFAIYAANIIIKTDPMVFSLRFIRRMQKLINKGFSITDIDLYNKLWCLRSEQVILQDLVYISQRSKLLGGLFEPINNDVGHMDEY